MIDGINVTCYVISNSHSPPHATNVIILSVSRICGVLVVCVLSYVMLKARNNRISVCVVCLLDHEYLVFKCGFSPPTHRCS